MNWLRHVIAGAAVLMMALACAPPAGRAQTNDAFENGIAFSLAGQFPEAAAAFDRSARAQPAAGTLLDLGLAEWQRGHAGAAILAWEQARWIDPFESRAAANLEFARQAAQVDAPELKWYESVSTWLPPNAWMWLAAGTLWLMVALLLLPRVFRVRRAGWRQWLAALAFAVFLLSVTASFGVVSRAQIGIVVRKNTALRLTPTREGEVTSTLAPGEPARRVRARGRYFFIRTPTASGWVAADEFQLICPP